MQGFDSKAYFYVYIMMYDVHFWIQKISHILQMSIYAGYENESIKMNHTNLDFYIND